MLNRTRLIAFGASLAFGAALFAACSSGDVSQNDYDKVKQQLQDQQTQNQQLQQQLVNAPKASATAAASGTSASGSATAASGDVAWVLGAKKVPSLAPAPTLAPGVTPTPAPPKPTAPASIYEPVPFAVYVETLATTHQSSFNIASTVACTPAGVFIRGQRIVWRYEVIDTSTGKRLTNLDGAKLKIVLPNGDEAAGSFSQRGGGQAPDAPFMWSSNWDIPLDYPLGAIAYKLVITTKDGKTFTWAPPALSSVPLKEDTNPTVVQ
jgi:hypothetical protein